jgi:hypothetical protein
MAVNDKLGATTAIDPIVWRVAAVALLGPFMSQMDSTVVNVSLSTIRGELHASIAAAQWILSGYLLALALMLPVNGWLVDRVGARRLYLGCGRPCVCAGVRIAHRALRVRLRRCEPAPVRIYSTAA